jgi:hypothetical protein
MPARRGPAGGLRAPCPSLSAREHNPQGAQPQHEGWLAEDMVSGNQGNGDATRVHASALLPDSSLTPFWCRREVAPPKESLAAKRYDAPGARNGGVDESVRSGRTTKGTGASFKLDEQNHTCHENGSPLAKKGSARGGFGALSASAPGH